MQNTPQRTLDTGINLYYTYIPLLFGNSRNIGNIPEITTYSRLLYDIRDIHEINVKVPITEVICHNTCIIPIIVRI